MTRECPQCHGRIRIAFQKRGSQDPQFIAFCSNYSKCPIAQFNAGYGTTENEALTSFHQKNPLISK